MDKNIKRTINLIQLLYSYNKFVSAVELSKVIGLSTKTVKSELEKLNEYLKDHNYGLFLIKQNKTYYLEREPVHYLDRLILSLNQESTCFFITLHLFDKKSNLREMFNRKYYSDSYFYKSKKSYKDRLKKFDLNLTISPTNLIGDERIIRFYLYSFYWENYGKVEWPFTYLKKDQIIAIVRKIEESIQISLSEIEQLKVAYWIAIIVNRSRNHNKLNSNKLNHLNNKIDSDMIEPFLLKNIKVDHQTLENEHSFLLSILLLVIDSKNWEKLIDEKKIVFQSGDMLDFSIQLCKSIEKNFRLKKGIVWQTIIYAVYRLVYSQLSLNGNFNERDMTYKNYQSDIPLFDRVYQNFCSEWTNPTNELWIDYHKRSEIWEELKYIVLESIDIKAYQHNFRVYISLSKGKLEELIVMDHLSKLNYNLVFETERKDSVDLLITDVHLSAEKCPAGYFFWNKTSIENNIVCLRNFLENMTLLN